MLSRDRFEQYAIKSYKHSRTRNALADDGSENTCQKQSPSHPSIEHVSRLAEWEMYFMRVTHDWWTFQGADDVTPGSVRSATIGNAPGFLGPERKW